MKSEYLDCWQSVCEFLNRIDGFTREPELAKDVGLCTHVQRAGLSMMRNIADAFERPRWQEKLQLYGTARSSADEIRRLLDVVYDKHHCLAQEVAELQRDVHLIGDVITDLMQSTQLRHRQAIRSVATSNLPSLSLHLAPLQ